MVSEQESPSRSLNGHFNHKEHIKTVDQRVEEQQWWCNCCSVSQLGTGTEAVGLLLIEPPWWIGSRNLTDSDKRLFGVACSIKQHLSPTPLLLTIISPFFISPSFSLLCCHGYAQPEPSRRRGTCQGTALRSPDAGRLRRRPVSHAVIVQFGL